MTWYLNGEQNDQTIICALQKGAESLMRITLKLHRQSIRITRKGLRRLFFMEKVGLWAHKTIFKNEYGVAIGKSSHHIWHSNSGTIQYNDHKFHYNVAAEAGQLVLKLSDHHHNPLQDIVLHIEGLAPAPDAKNADTFNSIILSCCWLIEDEMEQQVRLREAI